MEALRGRDRSCRSQESGVRSQESGVRSQESGVRSQESESNYKLFPLLLPKFRSGHNFRIFILQLRNSCNFCLLELRKTHYEPST